MYLSNTGLFRARWSNQIHDEWIRNLMKNNPSLQREQLERVKNLMNAHVPDCLVEEYEYLISGLSLPDEDDRHILATALKGQAEAIITFNLKDFPTEKLSPLGVSAIHPDEFLSDMFEMDPSACIKVCQCGLNLISNPEICLSFPALPRFNESVCTGSLKQSSSGLKPVSKSP